MTKGEIYIVPECESLELLSIDTILTGSPGDNPGGEMEEGGEV